MTVVLAIPYNAGVTAAPGALRICPECGEAVEGRVCPRHGIRPIAVSRISQDPESLIGTVFDARYRIDSVVGRGGMGTVFKAYQISLGRHVALKILRPELGVSPEQVLRFENEAHAASRLDHDNVIRVYDHGRSEDGYIYIVTQLLDGTPLSEVIHRDGPMPIDRAVTIGLQALHGLETAHEHGVVHRDLKPENIFLRTVREGADDWVTVLDFGIAKTAPAGDKWRRLTAAGTVVGTPLYMSPEQARGAEVDARADLYSLGAVLFELVVGSPPFSAESAVDVMMAHVQEPVPLMRLPKSPRARAFEAVVRRALAKQPKERFPDANAMIEALEAVRKKSGLVEVTEPIFEAPTPRGRRRNPASVTVEAIRAAGTAGPKALLAIGVLLVGVGIAGVMWRSRPASDYTGDQADPNAAAPVPPALMPAPPVAPAAPVLDTLARDAEREAGRVDRRVPSAAPEPRPARPRPGGRAKVPKDLDVEKK